MTFRSPSYTVESTNKPFYCFIGTSIEIPFPAESDIFQIFSLYTRKFGLTLFQNALNDQKESSRPKDSDKDAAFGPAIDTMLSQYYETRRNLVKGASGLIENKKLTGATIESICRGEAMEILLNRIRLRMTKEHA